MLKGLGEEKDVVLAGGMMGLVARNDKVATDEAVAEMSPSLLSLVSPAAAPPPPSRRSDILGHESCLYDGSDHLT